MLASIVARVVDFSRRFALPITLVALLTCAAMGWYVANTIKINTDIDQLMASDLIWRVKEKEMAQAFPHKQDRLVIVIDGANADLAEASAKAIEGELLKQPDLFKNVVRPDSIPFFQKNGFLFLSQTELESVLETLIKAQPMLGSLARDPSLRGLFSTMSLAIQGIEHGQADYKTLEPTFKLLADNIEANLQGIKTRLPWQSMMSDRAPTLRDLRKFIIVQPELDFSNLSPGQKARDAVKAIAASMSLDAEHGVSVRMTGSVALNDEEFASVAEGASTATIASFVLVILILFSALRSIRLILPIFITLVAGLIATTAFAMATIGSLNLISVAFAVMFVGIAVDFGIQFGVRFRDERHKEPDCAKAMIATAKLVATPITFAAFAAAIGFMAFIPTDYRGVSELGIIAGASMIIAYILNLTLLPALMSLFKPPAEPEAIGFAWAAPIDSYIDTNRKKLLVSILAVTIAGGALASFVRFDFDPLNLKNPRTESVSTMFDVMKDPNATPYTVEILTPSLEEANALAKKISALPEVDHTMTLSSFVPEEQDEKLAMIDDANFTLEPSLNPEAVLYPPSYEETIAALNEAATKLDSLGEDKMTARRLAQAIRNVTRESKPELLTKLHYSMLSGMIEYLERLRGYLKPAKTTDATITNDLRRDWIAKDGSAKIEVYPKGDARDHKVLAGFTQAVRTLAPDATGTAISIQESGKTVTSAFARAGALGLLSISILGLIVLRSLSNVARLVLPMILAGILTLGTMVLIHLPLNFANIIALPLLLSLGVTYSIYFISYWKSGQKNPLSSSMARAVLFSASTTLVAFGSLSLSSHPGTSGMGSLLTIALIYSVLSTFLVLPVLLDRDRSDNLK